MTNLTPIYVVGYPKSGTTWLTRLLADSLNCPSGGSLPKEDSKEPAAGGLDRPGKYIIRKGHFRLVTANKLVPNTHMMDIAHLKNEKIVFIVRDPRDIAVSAACYHGRSLPKTLQGMIDGKWYALDSWQDYVSEWLNVVSGRNNAVMTSYEKLRSNNNTDNELMSILTELDVFYAPDRVKRAVRDQSFHNTIKRINKRGDNMIGGKALNKKLLRKGIIGDWRNHFTQDKLNKFAYNSFGTKLMDSLGYLEDGYSSLS